MSNLKPSEIVKELDKYVIGQKKAKKSVAIALRNRWRRRQVPDDLKNEIAPKNIILIGPTGVGKTEIARRLANLTESPFYKVEASKFTEVGYVGRDVESMIRDLVELTVNRLKTKENKAVLEKAKNIAEERILDILLPRSGSDEETTDQDALVANPEMIVQKPSSSTREKLRKMLRNGKLDERYVDLDVSEQKTPVVEIFSNMGMEDVGLGMKDMLGNILPKNSKRRKVKVPEAMEIITQEEAQNLIDMDKIATSAVELVEQSGIIFIDEIDKVAGKNGGNGPEVSREGVQRDLLPIVEGSDVPTKYGTVKTDHILFIASGAFHVCKPSDLIPELQGRFPIRVELDSLGKKEFVRILTEPKNALLLQYIALLRTENVELSFRNDSVERIADIAEDVNTRTDNIGARRLQTLMECLLEDILFESPEMEGNKIEITPDFVNEKLDEIVKDEDLSRYIL